MKINKLETKILVQKKKINNLEKLLVIEITKVEKHKNRYKTFKTSVKDVFTTNKQNKFKPVYKSFKELF